MTVYHNILEYSLGFHQAGLYGNLGNGVVPVHHDMILCTGLGQTTKNDNGNGSLTQFPGFAPIPWPCMGSWGHVMVNGELKTLHPCACRPASACRPFTLCKKVHLDYCTVRYTIFFSVSRLYTRVPGYSYSSTSTVL